MSLNLTKTYTPAAGDVANATSYNTDMASLFNAFSGLEAQTSTLGALKITPGANTTSIFNVTNAAGTSVFKVDTTNNYVTVVGGGRFYIGATNAYMIESSTNNIDMFTNNLVASRWTDDQKFQVQNGIYIGTKNTNVLIDDASNGAAAGTLYIGVNTIDTTAPSDIATKTDIVDTKATADILMNLSVKDFKYKSEYIDDGSKEHTGLIAQDVAEIVPDAIIERSDGLKAINYTKLIPLLIKTVQELTARIEVLEALGKEEINNGNGEI